jgi:hypothetical protein
VLSCLGVLDSTGVGSAVWPVLLGSVVTFAGEVTDSPDGPSPPQLAIVAESTEATIRVRNGRNPIDRAIRTTSQSTASAQGHPGGLRSHGGRPE